MKKKVILTIVIVLIAAIALMMVGCENYDNATFDKGNGTPAQSNGGSVVVQGGYVYFINGYAGYLDDAQANWFGNPLKGAIMRYEVGGDVADAEVIVPKTVVSSAANTGFSIYGDYIYYVTPSVEEARDGSVLHDNLQFVRTGLDGQNTQVILEIENGTSTNYKYTPDGLLYVRDGKLYFKSTKADKFKASKDGEVVVEEFSSIYFPVNESGNASLADCVFYTVAATAPNDYTNTLYVYANGTSTKVIDKTTYTATQDYKQEFSISILDHVVEKNGDLSIFYTKTYYKSTSSTGTNSGVYAYRFSKDFSFDPAAERQISASALSAITAIGFEEGVLDASSTLTLYRYDVATGKAAIPTLFKDDDGSITKATVLGVADGFVYYSVENVAYRYKMDGTSYVQCLGADEIHSGFIAPELVEIDGDLCLVYFSEGHVDYLYYYNISEFDGEAQVETLLGEMTEEDIENDKKDDNDDSSDDHDGHNHDGHNH